ncbi:MAG: hypothetical protein NT062_36740 [Proteobacteria bacterium]|nr:hypothetical protein [Pseudomonadota bacterium]
MGPIKEEFVKIRVTADQKRALMEAAANEGIELSTWLRILGLRAAGVLPPAGGAAKSKPKPSSRATRGGR